MQASGDLLVVPPLSRRQRRIDAALAVIDYEWDPPAGRTRHPRPPPASRTPPRRVDAGARTRWTRAGGRCSQDRGAALKQLLSARAVAPHAVAIKPAYARPKKAERRC